MILSEREIQAALDRKSISIHPVPKPEVYSSTALDLFLAKEFLTWVPPKAGGVPTPVSPGHPDYTYGELAKSCLIKAETEPDGSFLLKSGKFILGWTVERFSLPHNSRLAARVEGKSSLARLGMGVHMTAPTVHAGFGHNPKDPEAALAIQLEIWNSGPLNILLTPGMAICQIIFEWVDGTPTHGYIGRFSAQGPQVAGTTPGK